MKYKNIIRFMQILQFVREVFCWHQWSIFGHGRICSKCNKYDEG